MNHKRECHAGWDTLIDELEDHLHYLSPTYVTHQIKEKFGTLRYYADYVPCVEDKPHPHLVETAKRMFHRLIDETERRSAFHCERCGDAGVLRNQGSWHMTLCDQCAAENPNAVDDEGAPDLGNLNVVDDSEAPVEETLELLADLMDHTDAVHVVVLPALLREAAETIKALRVDVINITSMDGEHIATIDGPLASEIYVVAVKEFIEKALENAMRDDAVRVGDA
jgi:hypothetical protein